MAKRNTKGLERSNKEKAEASRRALLETIDRLKDSGIKFSLTDVCRESGVSRTYIHNHPDLYELVSKYAYTLTKTPKRGKSANETLITALQHSNRKKDSQIKKLKKELSAQESYKVKYEEAMLEIERLNKELKSMYQEMLPDML